MANNETKIVITAATAQAEASLAKLGNSVGAVSRQMFDMSSVVGTLGGALTITAFAGIIKQSIDAADELSNLSIKTGTSVEQLAGLKYAAEQSDTSLQAVAGAAKKLSTNMAENPAIFKKFGIDAKDSTGALIQLADIFSTMPDGVEKTALAVKLMGKSGEEMIPFLNQGGEAIRGLVEQGKAFNPISAEMAERAAAINDNLDKLKSQAGGAALELTDVLIPGLLDTSEAMNRLAREGHPVLALLRGFIGLGKIPWDLILPPENLAESLSSANRLRDLKSELAGIENNLKRSGGRDGLIGKWLHGTREEQEAQALILKNQIAALEKFGADIDRLGKKTADSTEKKEGTKGRNLLGALGGSGSAKTDPNASSVLAMQSEAFRKQMELIGVSAEQVKVYELAMKGATAAQIEQAQAAADSIGVLNAQIKAEKDGAKQAEQAIRDRAKAQEEANRILFDLDPMLKLQAEWEKLIALKDQGLLTDEQVGQAYAKTFDDITKSGTDAFASLESATRGWGDEFTNILATGKGDFGSLVDSMILDMRRMVIHAEITRPLLEGLFGKGYGTGSNSTMGGVVGGVWGGIKDAFGFADGGIMSSAGPLPLNAYANGGIASSPQLALFGEGRMNEAYVPLPDGRTIPVTMKGGAGAQVVVQTSFAPVIHAAPGTDTGAIITAVRELMPNFIAENQRAVVGAVNQALVSRGQQPIRV